MVSPRESFYLGHLGPIPLYVHWTALLLVFMAWQWTGFTFQPTSFIAFLLILIASIVLHELGHGAAARLLARNEGERTVTITLWAFGGVCHSSGGDHRPIPRLIVVLAGPAVSLILWLGCQWLFTHGLEADWFPRIRGHEMPLSMQLLWLGWLMNQALFFFNMLPIFPLDGGQALYNGVKLVTKNYELARKATMIISVICAVTYFLWRCGYLIPDGTPPRIDIYLAAILGWALYSGWIALSRYHI